MTPELKLYPQFHSGLWHDESGQDLIEYALVAALIGLAALTGIKNFGTVVANEFVDISSKLTSAI